MRDLGRILVPVDFSFSSYGALNFAMGMAADSAAPIQVLHVIAVGESMDEAIVRMADFLFDVPNAPTALETIVEQGDPTLASSWLQPTESSV